MLGVEHLADADAVRRFRQEALILASLDTPHTVTVFDSGEIDGVPFIAMEPADGTLQDILTASGAVDPATAVRHVQAILAGLDALHGLGIVHRDLKPQNVLVWRGGRVKLTDLGVARLPLNELTDLAPGTVVGTAAYLSPEQARGATAHAAADLYAAGAILYTLLTGRVPFEGDDAIAVLRRHIRETPLPPSTHVAGIPAALDDIVLCALEKLPGRRFASAREFAAALTPLAGTVSVRPARVASAPLHDGPTLSIAPRRRRQVGLRGTLAAVGAAALLASAVSFALDGAPGSVQTAHAAPTGLPVPALSEMHLDAARYALEGSGLKIAVVRQPSDRELEGYVVAQRPAPGTSVPPNSTLTLVVSTGFPQVELPKVTGLDAAAAAESLRAVKLRAEVVKVVSRQRKGVVVRQEHRPGTRVLEGQAITLTVSDGPHLTRVPPVVGLAVADARSRLGAKRLAVRVAHVPSPTPAGTVVAQSLPPGARPQERTAVRINVSTGVPLKSVPELVGVDAGSALLLVRTNGLGLRVLQRAVTHRYRHGLVVEQRTPAGQRIGRGSIVTVVVGHFEGQAEKAPLPG